MFRRILTIPRLQGRTRLWSNTQTRLFTSSFQSSSHKPKQPASKGIRNLLIVAVAISIIPFIKEYAEGIIVSQIKTADEPDIVLPPTVQALVKSNKFELAIIEMERLGFKLSSPGVLQIVLSMTEAVLETGLVEEGVEIATKYWKLIVEDIIEADSLSHMMTLDLEVNQGNLDLVNSALQFSTMYLVSLILISRLTNILLQIKDFNRAHAFLSWTSLLLSGTILNPNDKMWYHMSGVLDKTAFHESMSEDQAAKLAARMAIYDLPIDELILSINSTPVKLAKWAKPNQLSPSVHAQGTLFLQSGEPRMALICFLTVLQLCKLEAGITAKTVKVGIVKLHLSTPADTLALREVITFSLTFRPSCTI
jgi:hypothetical protein